VDAGDSVDSDDDRDLRSIRRAVRAPVAMLSSVNDADRWYLLCVVCEAGLWRQRRRNVDGRGALRDLWARRASKRRVGNLVVIVDGADAAALTDTS